MAAARGQISLRTDSTPKHFIIPRVKSRARSVRSIAAPVTPGLTDCWQSNVLGGHFLEEDISLFDAPFFNFSSEVANVRKIEYRHTFNEKRPSTD